MTFYIWMPHWKMDSTSMYHPFWSWWYGVSYLTALFELTSGNTVFSRSSCSLMKINEWKTWCWRWCVSIRPRPSSAIMMDAGNFLATWMLGPIEGCWWHSPPTTNPPIPPPMGLGKLTEDITHQLLKSDWSKAAECMRRICDLQAG